MCISVHTLRNALVGPELGFTLSDTTIKQMMSTFDTDSNALCDKDEFVEIVTDLISTAADAMHHRTLSHWARWVLPAYAAVGPPELWILEDDKSTDRYYQKMDPTKKWHGSIDDLPNKGAEVRKKSDNSLVRPKKAQIYHRSVMCPLLRQNVKDHPDHAIHVLERIEGWCKCTHCVNPTSDTLALIGRTSTGMSLYSSLLPSIVCPQLTLLSIRPQVYWQSP
jgi:hypothetical protein